ncbi:restriction endonuclease subunit S [Acinetobacter baumannii]|uniref:restriction endonuclease subunit S n=1 Tax=Acinetobacter baumannii TaxID=470 RepID=UPI0007D7BE70|nr:restriction endonuclease subunit S [Acinetobacter baumannii]OAM13623.1 type I restriction endonuclease subunit S [Acinetobacter baumannii]
MNEWKEFLIEDLAEFCNAKRVPLSSMQRQQLQGSYPYYGASGIVDYVNDYIFEGSHVLISEDGENLKSRNTPIAFEASGKFWVNNHAHILKAKEPHLTKILIHYFAQLDLTPYLTGAVQPKLNKATLSKIPLYLPSSTAEQKAIASVLSSLDDKIDLLHRQNKTLEAMAETLFRQLFIEEAKEDWGLESLGHHIQTINGVSYKSSELNPSNIALVTLKNFGRNGGLRTDGFKEFTGAFKDSQIMEDGDIAVAHTDLTQDASLIGNPIYTLNLLNYDKLVISMDLVKVNLTSNTLTKCFLFHLLKSSDFKDHALACSNGSSVIHLSKKALPSFQFKYPPAERIFSFTNLVEPMDQKIQKNLMQIQTLEKLRDTLLPKLMSGEVRVNLSH